MSERDKRGGEGSEAHGEPFAHGHEDFVALFKKGLKFSEELLAENERLRFRIAALEATSGAGHKESAEKLDQTVAALKARLAELEAERERLLNSFREVESLNLDYKSRYAEIEEEHNNLANLYIASYQLHATLAFREIVQAVAEIVINLIGVHRFSLFMRDAATGTLHAIFAEGQDATTIASETLGQGVIGEAVANRAVYLREGKGSGPLAVVPLATQEATVGAIVIDELLVQKAAFSTMDHELFTLLGAHAATSLVSGLLREAATTRGIDDVLLVSKMRELMSSGGGER